MEELILKYNAMRKALKTLEKILYKIDVLSQSKLDEEMSILIRDSIIKRFEYCIDSFWKFLKLYLEEVQKIDVEIASPRNILRLSLESGIITNSEHKILVDAISDRNLTSHSYNEVLAHKIQQRIPPYFVTMKTILNKLCID